MGNVVINVIFLLIIICIVIVLLLGIGGVFKCLLELGVKNLEKVIKVVGNFICLMVVFGISLFIVVLIFLILLLKFFGFILEILFYVYIYIKIILIGLLFFIMFIGMSKLIFVDGRLKVFMFCMLIGVVINIILNLLFIFIFNMGIVGFVLVIVIG